MLRRELKAIQKKDVKVVDEDGEEVSCCWYDSLDGNKTKFYARDRIAIWLRAWKPEHPWHNPYYLKKNPITQEDASKYGKAEIKMIEDNEDSFQFQVVITLKKPINSDEIIPVLFTLSNLAMNPFGVTPREHWVESFSVINDRVLQKDYSAFLGT